MDEPFSAVDPVVRENLQDELLRLQSELGKTIVFVTHDIDEAIKLGDRVAVLRVGGVLAQYDDPGTLLSRPVDDFVSALVGRDRGYRGLGFRSADGLPLYALPTVAAEGLAESAPGWHLVVDDHGHPRGWHGGAGRERLLPVSSLYRVGSASLRTALDAVLSSPSGLGVAVDENGRAVGAILGDDVLRELAATRGDDRDDVVA